MGNSMKHPVLLVALGI